MSAKARWPMFWGLVLIFAVVGPAWSQGSIGWIPAVGLSLSRPADKAVREIYPKMKGMGFSFDAGVGFRITGWIRAEARAHYTQRSGTPTPGLARTASSKLTLIPLGLEAVATLPTREIRPFFIAGIGMMLVRERFSYALFEETHTLTGERKQLDGIVGAGLEKDLSPYLLRLAFRAYLAGGHREVLRPSRPNLLDRGSIGTSLFTLGLELARPFGRAAQEGSIVP